MAPLKLRRDLRRQALFLALQLVMLALLWRVLGGAENCKSGHLGNASAIGPQLPPLLPPPPSLPPSLSHSLPPGSSRGPPPPRLSASADRRLAFLTPHSRCQVLADGSVRPAPFRDSDAGLPFLFDTASMPSRKEACSHCPADENPKLPPCCGVCVFTSRRCDDLFPGQNRTQAAAKMLLGMNPGMQSFTPCELFQRIRGRTLWFLGDSQTWNLYYAAECFLREFAPSLQRTPALSPEAENAKLAAYPPPEIPPRCLQLALGTRVCGIRVYDPLPMTHTVLPQLMAHAPNFKSDLVVFNFGLHFATPGSNGTPANQSLLVQGLLGLAKWRLKHAAELPRLVWMDTPAQHFSTPDGSWPAPGKPPFTCRPLKAWHNGDRTATAGGPFNAPIVPLVPQLADAHLRVYNASVPLWQQHWPGDCTHYCHPSAYQHWLFLLNELLRDEGLGNAVTLDAAGEEGGDEGRLAVAAASAASAAAVAAWASMSGVAAGP